AQLEHAALAERRLFEQVRVFGPRQIVDGQPLAQTPVADADFRQVQLLHQRFEYGGAGDDDVGTVGIDPGHLTALIERQRAQQLHDVAELRTGHDVPFDERAPAEFPYGDFREIENRPRAADRLLDRKLPEPLERADAARADIALDAGVPGRGDGRIVPRAEEHARQADRPEFER